MGKKRKVGERPSGSIEDFEPNPADARLNIQSWEDVADSEDEFHIGRDKVLLEENPSRKRQRLQEERDALLEPSDEEVFAISGDESSFDEDDDEEDDYSSGEDGDQFGALKFKDRNMKLQDESDAEGGGEDDEEEDGAWGTSKKDYYSADAIVTEQDALEEEQEAIRLQKLKLQGMTAAHYGFDPDEWTSSKKDGAQGGEGDAVVQEIMPDIEITNNMPPEERSRILDDRYPEFKLLAKEFVSLQSEHEDLVLRENAVNDILSRIEKDGWPPVHGATVKRSALGGYLAALSMYFALLSSGPGSAIDTPVARSPAALRDHPIMETLMQCRELWHKAQDLPVLDPADILQANPEYLHSEAEKVKKDLQLSLDNGSEARKQKRRSKWKTRAERKASKAQAAAKAKHEAKQAERAQRLEEALANLDRAAKAKPTAPITNPQKLAIDADADADSDFGEGTALTAEEAAAKAQRKKTLRFYTSQIAQKVNRRSAAARDAGGDDDIPRRERLRDRQARLNAEAEARGRKNNDRSAALGGDSSDEDQRTNAARKAQAGGGGDDDGDEEYYDLVASQSRAKKEAKAAKAAAFREAAGIGARVEEVEEVGPDGKRRITYAIEKNKGLAPRRKKDVRNPRVKKRKKYDDKKKKLGSIRPVFKGGEGRGGYGGELTGIKANLIKSRKL